MTYLKPIIKRYAVERHEGEEFGDFCEREIIPKDATFHSVGTGERRGAGGEVNRSPAVGADASMRQRTTYPGQLAGTPLRVCSH